MGQPLFLCLIHGPWDVGLRRGQYDRVNDTNGRKCQQMYRRDPQAKVAQPETGCGMTRLLICDDSEVILDCLVSVLSPYPQINIVGTARNGREAVDKTRKWLRPVPSLLPVPQTGLPTASKQITRDGSGPRDDRPARGRHHTTPSI